jgi:hypothetical protein
MRNGLQLLFIFAVAFALLRFFPILLRLIEGAALSIRSFWWAILAFALGIWVVGILRRRNSG